jgi:hypothetical protein
MYLGIGLGGGGDLNIQNGANDSTLDSMLKNRVSSGFCATLYVCTVRKEQGMGKIMETVDNIGIKLFVLAALKEHQLYLLLFFHLFMLSASVNA